MQNPPDTHEHRSTIEGNFSAFLAASEAVDPDAQHRIFALYADRFTAGQEVLDVGTGRGDFLDALRERGVRGFGLDGDTGMAAEAQRRGHPIPGGDAITSLQTTPRRFDGVFMGNVVEHRPADRVVASLQGACRVLRPHGQLVIATPDPRSLHVHLNEFWRDATHVRLYDRHLLASMANWCGFDVRRVESHPATAHNPGSEWFGEAFVQFLRDHRPEPTRPVAAPTPRPMPGRAGRLSPWHATEDDARTEARTPAVGPHAGEHVVDRTMPWVRDALAEIQRATNGIQRALDRLCRDRERDAAQLSTQFAAIRRALDALTFRLAPESRAHGMMAEVTAQRLEDFLGHLYPPREYYLAGTKRSVEDHTSGPPALPGR